MKKLFLLCPGIFFSCASLCWSSPIADFRDDFLENSPATGWSYQWSKNGPVGTAANYVDLTWDAGATRYDDTPGIQGGTAEGWLNVNATGGHPPRGTGDLAIPQDGYTIMAYTIQPGEEGLTYFSGSFHGNDSDYRVYVNDTLMVNPTPGGAFNIKQSLGTLAPGDTVYVAVGPNLNDGSDGYTTDFSLTQVSGSIVADFQSDFQGNTPASGWGYHWNSGPIGDSSQYVDLVWNATGNNYNLDGVDGFPRGEPAAWVNITANGGHPGRGSLQAGDTLDHYAITSYTISQAGVYDVFGLAHRGDGSVFGLDMSIYVNDLLVREFGSFREETFSESLGNLLPGDKVYIAVGPDTSDGGDSFFLDFAISQSVPEPSSLLLLGCGGLALLFRRLKSCC